MEGLRQKGPDALPHGDALQDLALPAIHGDRGKTGLWGIRTERAVDGREVLHELLETAPVHDRVAELDAERIGVGTEDGDLHERVAPRIDGNRHEGVEVTGRVGGDDERAQIE